MSNLYYIFFILFPFFNSNVSWNPTVNPPYFSKEHGLFEKPFDLQITCPANHKIIYTLDGSSPENSKSAIISQDSIATVLIDPYSEAGGRGKNPAVIVRACAVDSDSLISKTITQTYLFAAEVDSLSPDNEKPGPGWPNPTTSGNQAINYGMDPAILNDERYGGLINQSLLAVPSISLVTDLENLFSESNGIYVNAYQDGADWERPVSVELLNPDGTEGFQIDAGIRIRGGASRSGSNPKHAFRLFFREKYGKAKLEYALFGDEGVDKFDKIDLRTSQNYSWSFPGHQGEYNTMNRDVFSRDLQGQMGQPYTRSRYYHLYINGVYWGLYQSQERSEARYAESYFGGIAEDYDVVKPGDDWPADVIATDGNLNAYQKLWDFCEQGFEGNNAYFDLAGLDDNGLRDYSKKKWLDIDNLIDFMLIIFYTGNFDCPITIWADNKSPRNFYGIYNRQRNDGFRFFVHDAEHTIRTTSGEHWATLGLRENRVDLGTRTDNYKMVVDEFRHFHPQWLHFRLCENNEYKIRFADRVYKHFFNGGVLSPENVTKTFLSRAAEIQDAIIAESARWGDTYYEPPRNKEDDWQPAVDDLVNNYFPYRTQIVLNQLEGSGIFPGILPPLFYDDQIEINEDNIFVEKGFKLKIQKKSASMNGSIVYTTDGKDPRMIGGGILPSSIEVAYETEIIIDSTTTIKARLIKGSEWSALHQISLFTDYNSNPLRVTEIHYHPLDGDSTNDGEYEFLELKNIGSTSVNLSDAYFDEAVSYQFPQNTYLKPKEFIVLSSDIRRFNERYGFFPFDQYSGQLNNGGETITLKNGDGNEIFSITYSDKTPWPELADGGGSSLVPVDNNPDRNQNNAENWRLSYETHGSPGMDDIIISEISKNVPVYPARTFLSQNYPNPFNQSTIITYTVTEKTNTTLTVFDITGRKIQTLVNRKQNSGNYKIEFNAAGLASGIYYYRLTSGKFIQTKKMVLIR